ncbi:MAG: Calcineurin-like phosphoesterase [Candidatus Kentron sp. G]|nr:MAG: Calcineurin-like phosphoesterase [Candidatus Kentron sp. G]VFM98103.1 MAG: Calcineurin-like phosphoesterase [Candidatus Kentron sp. G]VFN00524.1 MAG: Calcineurin-like phosphoesterase [Candidatus Kentron sp. G]
MTTLNWLHLSDWHQKDRNFDQETIRDALIDDIKERKDIDPGLERVDFVVFSGDLAQNGEATEFKAARKQLLEPVLDALGLNSERLFVIPGNHDFPRALIAGLPDELRRPPDESLVKRYLAGETLRKTALEPFRDYRDFVSGYTKQDSPDYASILHFRTHDRQAKVALLGLNSAWMCARKFVQGEDGRKRSDDERHIVVGEPQIHDALREIDDADIKIVVLHHPFEWLAKFERKIIKARLGKKCHFILHGHEHDPEVEFRKNTSGGNYFIISAGACFSGRMVRDPHRISGYNWVCLNLTDGNGVVYLRRWSEAHYEWIPDPFIDGYNGTFSLDPFPLDPLPHTLALSSETKQDLHEEHEYPEDIEHEPEISVPEDEELAEQQFQRWLDDRKRDLGKVRDKGSNDAEERYENEKRKLDALYRGKLQRMSPSSSTR